MRVKVRVDHHDGWIAALPEGLRHEFSAEELEQMKQQFFYFDEDGDGSIAASELNVLMKSMGVEIDINEIQTLIDRVDDNRSGELEFPEFVKMISDFRRGNGDKLASFIQYSKLVMNIRKELIDLQENPTTYCTPSQVKENAWEWKVLLRGPVDTPYEGGEFSFLVKFRHDYPFLAPVVVFDTQIYHPNFIPLINGKMVLYGLLDRWIPEWKMRGFFERVEQLLIEPNEELMEEFFDDTDTKEAMRQLALPLTNEGTIFQKKQSKITSRDFAVKCIENFYQDREKFIEIAKDITKRHAFPRQK